MSSKYMLINVADDETRIALVENNLLQELLIEHQTREQNKGNIYKGKVVQIQPGIQAAFVDYGQRRHGFLPLAEVNPAIVGGKKDSRGRARLQEGQTVLVQVTREEVDHKGAALTTNLMLAGRYMVMMPHSDKGGISKRISDPDERDRLKGFLAGIGAEAHSVIIRTAGIHRDLSELKKDYTQVKRQWEDIDTQYGANSGPGLIQEELDVITRSLRDYYTDDIEEIWVDQPEAFQKVLAFLKENAPRRQKDLKLFVGDRSLFASYKIEKQVEQLTSRKVNLRSGGSIVIDQTEALVAIDVNSGRSNQESSVESTALRTNLEAAAEIARQLRLRNLGGIIVVDFIDMDKSNARKDVEELMADSFARDRAQHKIGFISDFGLMEISRQRMAQRISNVIESDCPTCHGKGMIPSTLASVNLILRTIREMAAKGGVEHIDGDLPLAVANQLLNERRQAIMDLELEFGITIALIGNPSLTTFDESNLKIRGDKALQQQQAQQSSGPNRKRRRRRGGRDEEFDLRDAEVAEMDNADSESEEEATSEVDESAESGEVEKTKRRRRRKRRGRREDSPESEDQDQSSEEEEESSESEETEEMEAPEAEAAPAVAPTPRRPRREQVVEEEEEEEPLDFSSLNQGPGPIHPGCLFSDVRHIDDEFRKEIAHGFNMRLKGKAQGKVPKQISDEFLWQPRHLEEEPAAPQPVEKPEKPKARGKKKPEESAAPAAEAKPKKPRAKKAAPKKDDSELETPAKPRRGRPKKAAETAEKAAAPKKAAKPRKPAAKKAAAQEGDASSAEKPASTAKPKRGRPAKKA